MSTYIARRVRFVAACSLAFALSGCHRPSPTVRLPPPARHHAVLDSAPEPNGAADGRSNLEALATLETATQARFERVPDLPGTAHPLVCDLLGLDQALYVSHAVKPLDRSGARVHRFSPATGKWELAFDWDRGGRPHDDWARGGEGFVRLRVIDGRIAMPDADSPGPESFGVTGAFVENLILRTDTNLDFPALDDRPHDSLIVPHTYHSFDILRFHGRYVTTGGAINPTNHGPRYPAGLWTSDPKGSVFELAAMFAGGFGVARSTTMHRFGGRLYVGLQNPRHQLDADLAVVSGDLTQDHTIELLRISGPKGWLTRSMASDRDHLYWLGEDYGGAAEGGLFVTTDGLAFERVELPPEAGNPQDMLITASGVRYLLTRQGLYRSAGAGSPFVRLAQAPPHAFTRYDPFCGARLGIAGGELFAGSLRDGEVYRISTTRTPQAAR